MADPHNLPPQVIQAVQRGNLIEAIKQLRQFKPQLGLAEAKALIEAIQRQTNVPPIVQKAEAKVAAKLTAHAPSIHAHHAPYIPAANMDPHVSPGEVPRTHGTGFMFFVVAIAIVVLAAMYFGR